MKHFLSAFYVFTWEFAFSFAAMAFLIGIASMFLPALWPFLIPVSTGASVGQGVGQAILYGRPLNDGSVYNPWRFEMHRP